MKTKKGIVAALLGLLLIGLGFFLWKGQAGQSTSPTSSQTPEGRIRIGSKDFTENLIVAEIYALALEDAGFRVERVPNISSSLIHTALVNAEIDLYPEYTGTGLLSILKAGMETDPEKVYQKVKQDYQKEFQLVWLDYAAANDSQGLVIRTALAKELGIATISDLQKHAGQLRFASQGEFDQRDDGLPGLKKTYGDFQWKTSQIYDNSLKYTVLDNDEADVTPAYTTEGQLVNTDKYTLLEDDKQFWPPYNLAPVVRQASLTDTPDIESILNQVSKSLDTKTITELNAQVDVEGKEYTAVARAFYDSLR